MTDTAPDDPGAVLAALVAYEARTGHRPDVNLFALGPAERTALARLLARALRRGRALTDRELAPFRAPPPPPGVLYAPRRG